MAVKSKSHSHRPGHLRQSNKKYKKAKPKDHKHIKKSTIRNILTRNHHEPDDVITCDAETFLNSLSSSSLKSCRSQTPAKSPKHSSASSAFLSPPLKPLPPPPRLVAVVAFHAQIDISSFTNLLLSHLSHKTSSHKHTRISHTHSPDSSLQAEEDRPCWTCQPRTFKLSGGSGGGAVTVVECPRDVVGCLDVMKAADILVGVFGPASLACPAFDEQGYTLLSAMRLQGLPSVIGVCYEGGWRRSKGKTQFDVEEDRCVDGCNSLSSKQIAENRKFVARYFHSEFGSDKKLLIIPASRSPSSWDTPTSAQDLPLNNLLRAIAACPLKQLTWRQHRGYVLADKLSFLCQCSVAAHPNKQTHSNATSSHCSCNGSVTKVCVYGYVRGIGLCVEHPVHITGVGDFTIEKIIAASSPSHEKRNRVGNGRRALNDGGRTEGEGRGIRMGEDGGKDDGEGLGGTGPGGVCDEVIATRDGKTRESFVDECQNLRPYDAIAGEQTWPTSEELRDAAVAKKNRHRAGGEEEELEMFEEEKEGSGESSQGEKEDEELSLCSEGEEEDEEDQQLNKKKAIELEARSKEDMMFPDEVDTPTDAPASKRFARYRGLKSFRTSPWDAYEDLPIEYSRIFEFESYSSTMKFSKSEHSKACASNNSGKGSCGLYVCLVLASLDNRTAPQAPISRTMQHLIDDILTHTTSPLDLTTDTPFPLYLRIVRPLILSSVLPYELKISVLHLAINRLPPPADTTAVQSNKRSPPVSPGESAFSKRRRMSRGAGGVLGGGAEESGGMEIEGVDGMSETVVDGAGEGGAIESKRLVEFHCGFRRFKSKPLFSHSTITQKDKYKYQRFLRPGVPAVASLYGMTIAKPCSVLMTTPTGPSGSECEVLGWGSVLGSDSSTLITKRCILTGYPFRVHKTKAVVRYMFFNPKDIRWFQPVELFTKHGLRGHITEPLGTHGYMKCSFSDRVIQSDTVCMALYKRVYPKWYPPSWGGDEHLSCEEHPDAIL
eukprot:GHVQ01023649.1.p1 GENE.GHVQ01023649.1~~GHVQ01023649.1.p1  ORF type:complete len:999 (+),score=154.94 GHVQ01023649.1:316-3312(+)